MAMQQILNLRVVKRAYLDFVAHVLSVQSLQPTITTTPICILELDLDSNYNDS
ncbi:hypothetical protein PRUPE_4G267900 [Prunus persica]|uniref:Uncharacterized protein n=1 Tax=Prunus persica TaxID=3760 RepID=A0A251PRJ6_PRUPE|nr:hypothetical protein PRUPE_4G267900 [Prunus persica]